MKGLLSVTLAASLLGCVAAFAQATPANSPTPAAIDKIAGKKFYAADGASLTFLAFAGGLAREIHEPDGAVVIQTLALTGRESGTVSDAEDGSRIAGTFRLTQSGLTMEYNDGRSEILAANGASGMSTMLRSPAGNLTCTAWYPEGHRFSDAEQRAALIDISDRLDLDIPHPIAKHNCGFDTTLTHEARAHAHRHIAQTASSSRADGSVVARLPE